MSIEMQKKWSDLFRLSLETLAVDGYRSGAMSGRQVGSMLGLRTRLEVHAFLKQSGVYLAYNTLEGN